MIAESALLLTQPLSGVFGLNMAALVALLLASNPRVFLLFALATGSISLNILAVERRELLPSLGGIDPDGLRLVAFSLSFCALILLNLRLRNEIRRHRVAAAFVALAVFSLLRTPAPMEGLRLFLKICYPLEIYLLIVVFVRSQRDITLLLRAVLVSALLLIITGAVRTLVGGAMFSPDSAGLPRLQGALGASTFGMHAACTALMLFAWGTRSHKSSLKLLAGSAVFSALVVATFVRIVVAGFVVGMTAIDVARRKAWRGVLLGILCLVIITATTPIVARFSYRRSIDDLFGFRWGGDFWSTMAGLDTSGRDILWKGLWEDVFRDHAVVGAGMGSTTAYLVDRFGGMQVAHNEYLRILCEMGIVGLALGLVVVIQAIRGVWDTKLPLGDEFEFLRPLALGVLGCFLVCSLTDNTLDYYAVFTGYVATCVALLRVRAVTTHVEEDRLAGQESAPN